jgi:aminoglycoside 6'-N-acetyltransferase
LTQPHGVAVAVRRPGRGTGHEYLALHPSAGGVEADRASPVGASPVGASPAGARLPGEPVCLAALRVLRDEVGITDADLWAVDLSGPCALLGCEVGRDTPVTPCDPDRGRSDWSSVPEPRFATLELLPAASVAFRRMTRADLPAVVRWQAEPHVARWWDHESPDLAAAERNYLPAIEGDDPTRMWVVEVNGRSVGFLQDYRIGDHPEYALLTAEPDAIGIDYAIGAPSWVGKGIGTRMLWSFLRDVVRSHYPDATRFFAAPDHRNTASLRVLDKLGFTRGLWFDEPQRGGGVDTVVGCSMDVSRVLG